MSGTPIIRSDDLRAENRYRLLRTLRRDGPLPRAALGERTGLSQAAMSTLIAGLAGEGVLETASVRTSGATSRRGRPQTRVALAARAASVLTVALTIDRLRSAIVDYAGRELLVDERTLDTRALDADALLEAIGASGERLVRRAPGARVSHVGVAFQGITGNATGELLWSPIIEARAVPLGAALERRFAAPASVSNDCAMIARALRQWHGEELGPSFATVLFTHGVGMALTLDGRAFAGIRSSALEIGHLRFERDGALCRCGRRGCIEAYAADYGIARLAGGGPLDTAPPGRVAADTLDELIAAARRGERAAVQAFAVAGAAVGDGLAELFILLDPMPVALVGRSDEAFSLMSDGLHAALASAGFAAGTDTPGFAAGTDTPGFAAGTDTPGFAAGIDASGSAALAPARRAGPDRAGRHVPGGDARLHRFSEDDPLLHGGLALDSLDSLDRRFATSASPAGPSPRRHRPAGERA